MILNQQSLAVMRELPRARLPAIYESAKVALANCARIDECKTWADKMQALASYALQAADEELLNYAKRVKARAIEREADLLNEIAAATNQHDAISGGMGTHTGRMQAARDAGLSKSQTITALRVGKIPKDELDEAIESDDPPTITELARRGTKARPKQLIELGLRTPEEFQAATLLIGALDHLKRYSASADLPLAIAGLNVREADETTTTILLLNKWLGKVGEMLNAAYAR